MCFQGCVGPTGSFQYDSWSVLRSAAQTVFLLTVQRYGEEVTAEVALKSVGTLERQHFSLGFFPQKVCADDDVKGVSFQHSAVLHHRFIAKTNRHTNIPQGMDGPPICYSYGEGLSFLERF